MICSLTVSQRMIGILAFVIMARSIVAGSVSLINSPAWIIEKFKEQALDAVPNLINQSNISGSRHACERIIGQFESILMERQLGKLGDQRLPPKRAPFLLVVPSASNSYILENADNEVTAHC